MGDGLGGASGGQLLLLKGLPLWLHLCSHLLPSVLEELNSYFQKNKMRKVPEKKQDKLEFKCSKLSLSSVVLQVPEESPENYSEFLLFIYVLGRQSNRG